MRSEKAIKNVGVSVISYIFLLLAGLLTRKLLLINFDTELIGYENLLSDIFEYINIIDVGISGFLTYQFYEAFAKDNDEKLNELASIYKTLANLTILLASIVCVIIYVLLPVIFKGKVLYWDNFRIVYLLFSIKQVLTYYFGYWRTILASAQYEYKAIAIETAIELISIISKVVILYTTKSYLLYIIVSNCFVVLSTFFVYLVAKKQLPNIKIEKVSLSYIKENKIISKVKNLLIIKINETITWSSISLFISLLVDIRTASLFYNYLLFASMCQLVLNKIIKPLRSTLADLIYKESKEVSYEYYQMISMICFFLASTILCGYTCCFQQIVGVIFGEKYLLSSMFVVCFALRGYIIFKEEGISSYRNCFGNHDIEKNYSLLSIVSCLVLVNVLSKFFNESGVILAVSISAIIIWYSNSFIVMKKFYNFSLKDYWLKELQYLLIAIFETLICYFITRNLEINLLNMIICVVVCVIVPITANSLLFHKEKSFIGIINLVKSLLKIS